MTETEFPFISVVVCAFNEEKRIHSCLSGLAAQTYPPETYEVVIIDDESTDGTFGIVSDFITGLADTRRRMRLFRIQHGGLSVARNSGIQLSRGNIIAFIDGDAVPDAAWLEKLAAPFRAGADYVGGRIDLLNTGSWVARFIQRTRHRQFFGPRIFNDQCIGCNMAFRAGVFDAVGGFHENFVSRGDESTLRERIQRRFRYAPAPDAVVYHERPETIGAFARVEWKSATLSRLGGMVSGSTMGWRGALLLVEQLLMILFLVLICVVWLNPSLFIIPLIVSAAAVVRRLYLRPLNRAIAGGLIGEYGLLRGTLGHIFSCFLLNIISFAGGLVSPFIHRSARMIPPMTTMLTVLDSRETPVSEGK